MHSHTMDGELDVLPFPLLGIFCTAANSRLQCKILMLQILELGIKPMLQILPTHILSLLPRIVVLAATCAK